MEAKIVVATHKLYNMPEDSLYLPVQAGRALREPLLFVGDDTGENISAKNHTYCELTVLYWAWKNLEVDVCGLCHYRRYLAESLFGKKWNRILSGKTLERLMKQTDVILPKKRNYFIETNYTQYIHAHHKQDLDIVRVILEEQYPEYIQAFDRYMSSTKGHHFNMFIMRKNILDAYCTWLFAIMEELEKRLDISTYDEYNKRVFGFVSERLLDTWLETNHISYKELPVVYIENQKWIKKGTAFILRKLNAGRKKDD